MDELTGLRAKLSESESRVEALKAELALTLQRLTKEQELSSRYRKIATTQLGE